MKKIFGLFVVVFAVAFAACNDENTDNGSHWFQQPTAVVAGTTVEVSCLTTFGDGVLTSMPAGFAYAPIGDAVGEFAEITETTVNGKVLSCQLEALEAQTTYLVYAFVVVGGERMQSAPITFQTGDDGDEPEDPTVVKPTFGALTSAALTASSATVSGSFAYTGDKPIAEVYFQYSAPTGSGQHAPVSVDKGNKSATLSGLAASTSYTYRLCVVIGSATYSSESATFTTLSGGGGDPIVPGLTKYSGWAELPVEVGSSDYYYAYHLCPDFKVNNRPARNFTVCYSAEHHCPIWVAAPLHNCYVGSNGDRRYGPDPVIPKNIQPTSKTMGSPYNKGHMLGNRERSGTSGMNKQVSYYTNMAPQHSQTFNTGNGAWNNLEDYIDKHWCNDTLYMVTGCRFDTWTDSYGNTASPKRTSFGGVQASVPTMFYYVLLRTRSGNSGKSVTQCSASELKCVGFVMSHAMPKGHKPERRDMRSVAEIEKMAGFQFFTNVPNAPKDSYTASDWGF
ncbi:MAG: DNA/RNA non-specific endonuclease [Alistipes sp.]